jgi:hypothetical protein
MGIIDQKIFVIFNLIYTNINDLFDPVLNATIDKGIL